MRQKQKGVTLILSLIMLVLLTIMALSSFTIGKSSLQVVDNAQQQAQAQNAAQAMLDQVVSTPDFVESKNETGRRSTWRWISTRMSLMARCAATLTICDSANDVTAWTSVAAPTASARGVSR